MNDLARWCRGHTAARPSGDHAQGHSEILRVGEKTNHIDAIAPFEVKPAARKAFQPAGPQAVDAGHLFDPRRACARPAPDVSRRPDRSVEET